GRGDNRVLKSSEGGKLVKQRARRARARASSTCRTRSASTTRAVPPPATALTCPRVRRASTLGSGVNSAHVLAPHQVELTPAEVSTGVNRCQLGQLLREPDTVDTG